MKITKYKGTKHWAIYDNAGKLICVAVYKKGAEEVVRRLMELIENNGEHTHSVHVLSDSIQY